MEALQRSITRMTHGIANILSSCYPSVYLYGSVALRDFKPGWSDIDLLVLTRDPISDYQAHKLLGKTASAFVDNPTTPAFE